MRFPFVVTTVFSCLLICSGGTASAQQADLNAGPRFDLSSLLRNVHVQREIELVDDQRSEIESIQEEMWTEMRERMNSVRGLEPAERRQKYAELREEMRERKEVFQAKMEEVLLPQQLKRLKQLQVQQNSRRRGNGMVGILQNEELLAELGIDEETKAKLEEKAETVLEELKEKIKRLRAEAEKEILSVLNSDQRQKFQDKIGEAFEFGRESGFASQRKSFRDGKDPSPGLGGR